MVGVYDGIADLKRHLASTPSAEGHLITARTAEELPVHANMQVKTLISSAQKVRSNVVRLALAGS
jgi:hypothetical protein